MVSESGSSLLALVEVEQNDVVSSLAYGVSRKMCAQMQRRKSWFQGRLGGTLFEKIIIGCALKVSQYLTSIKSGKTYEYISK